MKNTNKGKRIINKKQLLLLGISIPILIILIIVLIITLNSKDKKSSDSSVEEINIAVNDNYDVTDQSILDKNIDTDQSKESNHAPESEVQTSISQNETISDNSAVSENTVSENTTLEEDDNTDDNASTNNISYTEDEQYLLSLNSGTILNSSDIDLSNLSKYFKAFEIPDNIVSYISGKSYHENNNVSLSDLRYIKLLHYNFNGEIQVGELIVNKKIANDIVSIFKELFENKYQIQSMYLIDRYWTGEGDSTDTASIDVNNTSCFLYRNATNSSKLSKHAYGMAIDINPQQNPYVSYKNGTPKWYHENANDYINRDTGLPHVITHDDLCYQIFKKYGFSWGGDWNTIKDYQHFEK